MPKWRLARYYTKISVESVCLHVADQFFFLDFVAWHSQFVYFFSTMIIKLMELSLVCFNVMGHK
jgi:hypothetical protein